MPPLKAQRTAEDVQSKSEMEPSSDFFKGTLKVANEQFLRECPLWKLKGWVRKNSMDNVGGASLPT